LAKTNTENWKTLLLFENKKMIWGSEDERYYIYSIEFKKETLAH
jgi:hypothetical protein